MNHIPYMTCFCRFLKDLYPYDFLPFLVGVFSTVQMHIEEVGTWLLHCHVNDHMTGGMEGVYKVKELQGINKMIFR